MGNTHSDKTSDELASLEKKLFTEIQENNFTEVRRLILVEWVPVNCVDADGMTPLQHAAYKGIYRICEFLLYLGADVNLTKHKSQYSALHFAALSGNTDVVNLLLRFGASTTSVNSINKTAAELATFVSNHLISRIITNFKSINEIEYFCQLHCLEIEPKLPLNLTPIVHEMSIMTNINPIRLALFLQSNLSILYYGEKVTRIFNVMADKFYKHDCDELLSLKFHHIAYNLEGCFKNLSDKMKRENRVFKLTNDCLIKFIRRLIKGNPEGFPNELERFIREIIRRYPYPECSLHKQLVKTLSSVQFGHEPSAISIINEALNGQRGLDRLSRCATCGDPFGEKKCSACNQNEEVDEAKNQCSGGAEIPRSSEAEKAAFSNSDGAGCSHDE
ncbi:ankyrin repeat and MYND domain-containing protein 2 [Trichonephila clavata]|uniref:Ankyrin repeat and MYND domain-containing protein 2 n=1 Tax=Trichonephila clavata TaxID=2740835 RepID=A0A8X6GTF0_TRICU|nr:ankyrin repeat and MYND domain-containing protein 2 [Trichonephila clavata]